MVVSLMLLSFVSAEIVSGKIVGKGKFDFYLENGSQSINQNKAKNDKAAEKFQLNYITTLGFNYGIANNWAVGLEIQPLGISHVPGMSSQHVYWSFTDGFIPGSAVLQYAIGKVVNTNLKVKARYNLVNRKMTLDEDYARRRLKITEKAPGVKIHDQAIGIFSDTALTKKLDLGLSVEYLSQRYAADEALEASYIDLGVRNSMRVSLGLNCKVTDALTVYIYDSYKGDSDAVGKHDDDVFANPAVAGGKFSGADLLQTDSYNVLMFGMKYDF